MQNTSILYKERQDSHLTCPQFCPVDGVHLTWRASAQGAGVNSLTDETSEVAGP